MGLHVGLLHLSAEFLYVRRNIELPITLLVGILVVSGIVYLVAVVRRPPDSKPMWIWITLVGLVMRGTLFVSTPMLEDDFFRYLWDGAVLAHGHNPFAYVPEEMARQEGDTGDVHEELRRLAARSEPVVSRINHRGLRTIYPMVAQAAFALAYCVRPWSLLAWRAVLFCLDVATLVLLLALLRALRLPAVLAIVYWWNPVVVKEGMNSAHMDLVVMPFVLGAILLAVRGRWLWAVCCLSLATAGKIWPVLLVPVVLRRLVSQPVKLLVALAIFGLLTLMLYLPPLAAGLGDSSGFTAYGRRWEMNDALFMLVLWACQGLAKLTTGATASGPLMARVATLAILGAWIARVAWRDARTPAELCERCLLVVAALFLLSPTQFPAYYTWLAPLLAL